MSLPKELKAIIIDYCLNEKYNKVINEIKELNEDKKDAYAIYWNKKGEKINEEIGNVTNQIRKKYTTRKRISDIALYRINSKKKIKEIFDINISYNNI